MKGRRGRGKKRRAIDRKARPANEITAQEVDEFLSAIRNFQGEEVPYPKLRDLGRLLPSMSPFKINVILRYLQRLEAIVVDNDGYITWVRDKEGSGQQLTLGDVATMSDELKEFLKKSNAEEGEDEEKEEEE